MEKLNGFISHAHEDAALCELLLAHLVADETRNHVTFWTSRHPRLAAFRTFPVVGGGMTAA
jgi:hypothetical protein